MIFHGIMEAFRGIIGALSIGTKLKNSSKEFTEHMHINTEHNNCHRY